MDVENRYCFMLGVAYGFAGSLGLAIGACVLAYFVM